MSTTLVGNMDQCYSTSTGSPVAKGLIKLLEGCCHAHFRTDDCSVEFLSTLPFSAKWQGNKDHSWELEKVRTVEIIKYDEKLKKWKYVKCATPFWNVQRHSDVKAHDQKVGTWNVFEPLHLCSQASNANAGMVMREPFQEWQSLEKMWQMYLSCSYSMLYVLCLKGRGLPAAGDLLPKIATSKNDFAP